MIKNKVIKRLTERRNICEDLTRIIKDKDYRYQLFGEILGIDYAIALLNLEEDD